MDSNLERFAGKHHKTVVFYGSWPVCFTKPLGFLTLLVFFCWGQCHPLSLQVGIRWVHWLGSSDDGWLQVVNMGRFPTPWGCGESLSGKELSKFCMSRSLKMMKIHVFILNHTWVFCWIWCFVSIRYLKKKGILGKKHTFNNSSGILLDVIGCHLLFLLLFFLVLPYLNSILLVEDFLPRWISQAPPPGSYRPSTHLCEPRVKTPARISGWCEDTQCLNFLNLNLRINYDAMMMPWCLDFIMISWSWRI